MTGAALAAGSSLWLPGTRGALAADDTGGGEDGAPTGSTDAGARPAGVVTTRNIPAPNLRGVTAPPIVRRAEWGADESLRLPYRAFSPIRKIVVHHSASANRPGDPASVVREIYTDSIVRRGYSDLLYNFLIDHRGNIYEGRYSRRYGDDEPITGEDHNGWGVIGAHAKGTNAGTCGICLIGNFELGSPTDAALTSLQWLIAWKASRHRIDASDTDPYVNVYGSWSTFANVSGHRNVGLTMCPGTNLYRHLDQIRANVTGMAGHWDPLIAETPRLVRYDWTPYGQGPMSGQGTPGASPGTGAADESSTTTTTAAGETSSTTTTTTAAGGSGPAATAVTGYRAVTDAGQVFTVGSAAQLGSPGAAGGTVVAVANPGWGDGFLTLTSSGTVAAFGALSHLGDVVGQADGPALDLAVTSSGAGYWILMANGGIYPFGDARYWSSPKRTGITAAAVGMAARPQGDGYWVLFADGSVRGFGAAASLGGPGTGSGTPVDIAATGSGGGYWVLLDSGEVAGFGDAPAAGGMASRSVRWAKPAVAIARAGADGYVISARDGGLYTFHGAPYLGSFAGSGARVAGIVPAAR